MGWRTITVGDRVFKWKTGNWTEVRLDGQVYVRIDSTKMLGMSPDGFERGVRKRTLSITPADIRKLIDDVPKAARDEVLAKIFKQKKEGRR